MSPIGPMSPKIVTVPDDFPSGPNNPLTPTTMIQKRNHWLTVMLLASSFIFHLSSFTSTAYAQ